MKPLDQSLRLFSGNFYLANDASKHFQQRLLCSSASVFILDYHIFHFFFWSQFLKLSEPSEPFHRTHQTRSLVPVRSSNV